MKVSKFCSYLSLLIPASSKASFSSISAASNGFSLIRLTLLIIFSKGVRSKSYISLEKITAPTDSIIDTKIVLIIDNIALS